MGRTGSSGYEPLRSRIGGRVDHLRRDLRCPDEPASIPLTTTVSSPFSPLADDAIAVEARVRSRTGCIETTLSADDDVDDAAVLIAADRLVRAAARPCRDRSPRMRDAPEQAGREEQVLVLEHCARRGSCRSPRRAGCRRSRDGRSRRLWRSSVIASCTSLAAVAVRSRSPPAPDANRRDRSARRRRSRSGSGRATRCSSGSSRWR